MVHRNKGTDCATTGPIEKSQVGWKIAKQVYLLPLLYRVQLLLPNSKENQIQTKLRPNSWIRQIVLFIAIHQLGR